MAQFACGGMGIMVRYLHLYRKRRPIVKLQEGIFFGRRKLALAVCLVALATGSAHATIYYSGRGSANGTLATAVKWYTNESRTVAADPQPTPTANDGNTYVFIESMKMYEAHYQSKSASIL